MYEYRVVIANAIIIMTHIVILKYVIDVKALMSVIRITGVQALNIAMMSRDCFCSIKKGYFYPPLYFGFFTCVKFDKN